jgi:hypothetical protein
VRELLPSTDLKASKGPTPLASHRALKADPEMVAAALAMQADKPLSFQKVPSQVARELIHIERITGPDGEVTEAPRLNRKGRRKQDALERRKFKPATRRLNKHEMQQLMLNKYEDSLETKRPKRMAKQKKKKRAVVTAELPAEPTRAKRLIERAAERALQAIGL